MTPQLPFELKGSCLFLHSAISGIAKLGLQLVAFTLKLCLLRSTPSFCFLLHTLRRALIPGIGLVYILFIGNRTLWLSGLK
jgi:hypothetical protein